MDFECGVGVLEDLPLVEIRETTLEDILQVFDSAIGIDPSKNHTGISIWRDGKLTTLGFQTKQTGKDDPFEEARMRLDFKRKLADLIRGMSFEVCVVEEVYGGANFTVTRKLIAVNTVIDELILEGVVEVKHFHRLLAQQWGEGIRDIVEIQPGFKSKIRTQIVLEHLKVPFYMENKDLSQARKKEIYFEDKCDAIGMLLGLAMIQKSKEDKSKPVGIKISDVQMYFVEDFFDVYNLEDDIIEDYPIYEYETDGKEIEFDILEYLSKSPQEVAVIKVEISQLGRFGIEHKFKFYPQQHGFIVCYLKDIRKGGN